MPIKDAFEMFVKIFHRYGMQFMKDPSDFYTIISMRVAFIPAGH